ncbi:MAG TPA: cytochrome c3 family protein, partial [Desulfomonilia bacterium]
MSKKRVLLLVALVLGLALLLAACQKTAEPTACPTCPTATCPEATPCPAAAEAGPAVPYMDAWKAAGHAASDSEAFRHWDASDPAVVPTSCAKCHAGAGLAEFLATGKNEATIDAKTNMGIDCVSCHNAASSAYTSVTFPSGVVISGLGREALCMTCHQGRESKVSVDAQI